MRQRAFKNEMMDFKISEHKGAAGFFYGAIYNDIAPYRFILALGNPTILRVLILMGSAIFAWFVGSTIDLVRESIISTLKVKEKCRVIEDRLRIVCLNLASNCGGQIHK